MNASKLLVAVFIIATAASPAVGASISGQATVIDGDTLEIHGQRIRPHGVDAPESRQSCEDAAGRSYACGRAAAFALADWIGRSIVECDPRGRDRNRRMLAVCTVRARIWAPGSSDPAMRSRSDATASTALLPRMKRERPPLAFWKARFMPPWMWRESAR